MDNNINRPPGGHDQQQAAGRQAGADRRAAGTPPVLPQETQTAIDDLVANIAEAKVRDALRDVLMLIVDRYPNDEIKKQVATRAKQVYEEAAAEQQAAGKAPDIIERQQIIMEAFSVAEYEVDARRLIEGKTPEEAKDAIVAKLGGEEAWKEYEDEAVQAIADEGAVGDQDKELAIRVEILGEKLQEHKMIKRDEEIKIEVQRKLWISEARKIIIAELPEKQAATMRDDGKDSVSRLVEQQVKEMVEEALELQIPPYELKRIKNGEEYRIQQEDRKRGFKRIFEETSRGTKEIPQIIKLGKAIRLVANYVYSMKIADIQTEINNERLIVDSLEKLLKSQNISAARRAVVAENLTEAKQRLLFYEHEAVLREERRKQEEAGEIPNIKVHEDRWEDAYNEKLSELAELAKKIDNNIDIEWEEWGKKFGDHKYNEALAEYKSRIKMFVNEAHQEGRISIQDPEIVLAIDALNKYPEAPEILNEVMMGEVVKLRWGAIKKKLRKKGESVLVIFAEIIFGQFVNKFTEEAA